MAIPLAFASSLIFALALTPLARRLAWASDYLDRPAARKLHLDATALLGGAAVFAAALLGWWLARSIAHGTTDPRSLFLLGGACVALTLGLVDDRFGMRPSVKLGGQALAAALALASGALPPLPLPVPVTWAVCVFLMIALMNAVNFLDNMNGMVGGIAAVALTAFGFHSATHGAPGLAAAQFALAGAAAGFLRSNFPKASIFLGDAGSLVIGYSLGASALLAAASSPPGWGLAGIALMLGYPAFDMIFVVVTRLRDGRPVYEGGKDHTNHRLASVLKCPIRTVILVWCSTAVLCAAGLVVLWLNRPGPAMLAWGLWSATCLPSGLSLSSVPLSPRSPAPPSK